jgi:hypothetical protein
MALDTPVELAGLCRVLTSERGLAAAYEFSNGFDTGTPEGATAGAAAILVNGVNDYTLFLTDAVGVGSAVVQAGLTVDVLSVGVAGGSADVPTVTFANVEYNPILAGAYAAVDRQKAIRIRFYSNPDTPVIVERFTVRAHRNSMTLFP